MGNSKNLGEATGVAPQHDIAPVASSSVLPPLPGEKTSRFSSPSFAELGVWLMELGPMTYPSPSDRWNMEDALELALMVKNMPAVAYSLMKGGGKSLNMSTLPPISTVLHEMTKNSHEAFLQEVRDLVKEDSTRFGKLVMPLATFSNHAIVMNEKKELFRVQFDRNESTNKLYVHNVEVMPIPIRDHTQEEMLNMKADTLVESLVSGNKEDAKTTLLEFMEISGAYKNNLLTMKYKAATNHIKENKSWKKYLNENKYMVRKHLRGQLSEIKQMTPRPKFADIYSVSNTPKAEIRRKEVVEALKVMYKNMETMFKKSTISLNEGIKQLEKTNYEGSFETDSTLSHLNDFATNYLEDLNYAISVVKDALVEGAIKDMALVHDAVAENYENYELASRLINKILTDFTSGLSKVTA